jgi:hypothetical protein
LPERAVHVLYKKMVSPGRAVQVLYKKMVSLRPQR